MTGDVALTPKLTRFDKRVLRALEPWPTGLETWRREADRPLPWSSAWAVAEKLGEDDVPAVRATLQGLAHLGYVMVRGWGKRATWIRLEKGTEAMT